MVQDNRGYWKNKESPYLIIALNLIQPHVNELYESETLNCFHFDINIQITEIKYYALNLNKHEDNSQKINQQLEKIWPGWYKYMRTDQ